MVDTVTARRLKGCYVLFGILFFARTCESEQVDLQPVGELIEFCAGRSMEVTCKVKTYFLVWKLDDEAYTFTATTGINALAMIGDFTLILLSNNPQLVSTAALSNIDPSHNGTVLTCANAQPYPLPEQMASITILVQDPPSAPMGPEFSPQSLTKVVLSWTPPTDSLCVTSYTITLTNITEGNVSYIYKTTTNTTSKSASDFTQGAAYSFTVAGVDAGGRVGEKSVSSEIFTFDAPAKVYELEGSISSGKITITWMPPPPSSRPPVTGYKISHNTTGSVLVNQTSDMEFTVKGVAPGFYLFAVLAVNILGDGEEERITAIVVLSSTKTTAAVAVTTSTASEILVLTYVKSAGSSTMILYHHSPSPVMTLRQNLILPSSTLDNKEVIIKQATTLKELTIIIVPVVITSATIIIIITALVILTTVCNLARRKLACPLQAVSNSPQDNLTCSENVAYDTVSNTLKMSTQVNMTCSENIAYATVSQTSEDSMRNTTTSHTAVYDEVSLRKY